MSLADLTKLVGTAKTVVTLDNIGTMMNNKGNQFADGLKGLFGVVKQGATDRFKEGTDRIDNWLKDNLDSRGDVGMDDRPVKSVINLTGDPIESPNVVEIPYPPETAFAAYQITTNLDKLDNRKDKGGTGYRSQLAIRRPTLGTVAKDNAPGFLTIVDGNNAVNVVEGEWGGASSPEANPGFRDSLKGPESNEPHTFNFLVQGVVHSYAEIAQVVQTFGKAYIFLFGSRPVTLSVQALLLNTIDFNWRNDFIHNWISKNVLSASSLPKNKMSLFVYDDLSFQGFITNMSISDNAENRDLSNLSFDMIVTRVRVFEPAKARGDKRRPADYNHSKDKPGQEYWEYVGPEGAVTKDGQVEGAAEIEVYKSFASSLEKYIGFNLGSINRIKTAMNLLSTGDKKTIATLTYVTMGMAAQSRGVHIYEIDKILTTPPSEVL